MNLWVVLGTGTSCLFLGGVSWLVRQLLRQNGRMLLRLDEFEKRLDELELIERAKPHFLVNGQPADQLGGRHHRSPLPQGPREEGDGEDLAARLSHRSLASSRIRRDGLKAGTSAPNFSLPRLDGGEVSLAGLRGERVLLVFSDPQCGPCSALAPHLESFHRQQTDICVMMISRGEPRENRVKVKEHGLTFLIALQRHWEISRLYAMFATPVAYLIDEEGIVASDVAVGVERILALMSNATHPLRRQRR